MIKALSSDRIRRGRTGFVTGAKIIRAQIKTMPDSSGVYRMLGDDGAVLYVGKAKNLKKRVASYTSQLRLPNRLQRMVAQTHNMEIVVTHTEAEALLLEANLIQRFMPPFNVLLRDDKSFPYILITRDHDFSQLAKHRGKHNRKGWYFGPFASAGAVDETLTLLQRVFMIRNCSDSFFALRSRPCLQYHIKRCTAPCVNKVSKDDYAQQVKDARDFLSGKTHEVQKKMAAEMQSASDATDFERAAILRDRIKLLTNIQSRQDINLAGLGDADVIAAHQDAGRTAIQIFFFRADRNYGTRTYYPVHDKNTPISEILKSFIAQFYADKFAPPLLLLSHSPDDAHVLSEALSTHIEIPKLGNKKRLVDHALRNAKEAMGRKLAESSEQAKLLEKVAVIFGLPDVPKRIEVYDNSHISGKHAVGCMIAAGAEGFLKKTYRKFNIREAFGGDDFAMMNEVLTRRFRRLIEEDLERTSGMWPDLILIDGGQGQLNAVKSVLSELGVDGVAIVGIAKGPDRNAGRERFFMEGREAFSLPINDPALYYLQRLRDEAHRFAIGTHRAKRAKSISKSELDGIAGIGPVRKKALLHHFGSSKAVSAAGITDLTRVEGISAQVAKIIHDYFHSKG